MNWWIVTLTGWTTQVLTFDFKSEDLTVWAQKNWMHSGLLLSKNMPHYFHHSFHSACSLQDKYNADKVKSRLLFAQQFATVAAAVMPPCVSRLGSATSASDREIVFNVSIHQINCGAVKKNEERNILRRTISCCGSRVAPFHSVPSYESVLLMLWRPPLWSFIWAVRVKTRVAG